MTKEERERIYQTYRSQAHDVARYNDETVKYIDSLQEKSKINKVDVWEELSNYRQDKKSGVTGPAIKESLREYIGDLQGNRCCYCRRWLNNIAHAKPVEHVLSRADYPQFSLDFFNLAISCFDCNQLKGKTSWGKIKKTEIEYPPTTELTDFYHPRVHRYATHVSYQRLENNDFCSVTYLGHTPQGMHLCHEILYIIAARENLYGNTPTMAQAVNLIREQQEILGEDAPVLSEFLNLLNLSTAMQLDQNAVDELPLKI
ncbi:hypothetical protein N015_16240 [Pseudomonas asturiensis]|uniref:TIGR02646 family protein n=1 Tax=Pseudomonas asturiensis TaxID=1190415 RepID=A0ABX6HE67_9PSED|nr:hypothetical protein [Pseudomonas asturiensis]QHF03878.1 hypothetical protein N015_16240 [Pseudomonas asturiensis]